MEPADCLCFNLRKATRIVSRTYDGILAPLGLKNTQFSLLAVLSAIGPSPVSKLADFMVMERTTLTRNMRPLERAGLLSQGAGKDRRQRIVRLTPAGRRLFAKAHPLWESAQVEVRKLLGAQQADRLLRSLRSAGKALA